LKEEARIIISRPPNTEAIDFRILWLADVSGSWCCCSCRYLAEPGLAAAATQSRTADLHQIPCMQSQTLKSKTLTRQASNACQIAGSRRLQNVAAAKVKAITITDALAQPPGRARKANHPCRPHPPPPISKRQLLLGGWRPLQNRNGTESQWIGKRGTENDEMTEPEGGGTLGDASMSNPAPPPTRNRKVSST
jgi:hypothetical protein